MNLHLTTIPEIVTESPAPLLYRERKGPFLQHAPLAWKEFWDIAGGSFNPGQIIAMAGLSRIDETKEGDEAFIYQAGLILKAEPASIPAGLELRTLPGGTYARFLLTGSYAQLPAAYPAIFAIMEKETLQLRLEFCMERYLNSPVETPEEELKTEILIPIR